MHTEKLKYVVIQHDVTVCFPFNESCKKPKGIQMKTDIINEDNRQMSCYIVTIVEIFCLVKGKMGLVFW